MKIVIQIVFIALLLFSSSCKAIVPQPPLSFSIIFESENFQSFKEVSAIVILKNVGKENILVNRRLAFQTTPFYPPGGIEGLFLITDSSGQQVIVSGKVDMGLPRDEFFVVLSPGEAIQKKITLNGLGFYPEEFDYNELYTVVVIYQNSLEAKQIVDGEGIQAWTGRVESNDAVFKIIH